MLLSARHRGPGEWHRGPAAPHPDGPPAAQARARRQPVGRRLSARWRAGRCAGRGFACKRSGPSPARARPARSSRRRRRAPQVKSARPVWWPPCSPRWMSLPGFAGTGFTESRAIHVDSVRGCRRWLELPGGQPSAVAVARQGQHPCIPPRGPHSTHRLETRALGQVSGGSGSMVARDQLKEAGHAYQDAGGDGLFADGERGVRLLLPGRHEVDRRGPRQGSKARGRSDGGGEEAACRW